MFHGSSVALVTPMRPTGEIHIEHLKILIEKHIAEGTSAIIVNGSTGEGSSLSEEERCITIQTAVAVAQKRIPIIAGTGTCSTAKTIERTLNAKRLGVDACLIVTPYYTKPTQEGLYQHFKAIGEAANIPIILYNVPSRTGCDLLPETVQRLSQLPYIIGIKEATGDLTRVKILLELCQPAVAQSRFHLYSGDDPSALAFMLQGGKGVISITANAAPKAMQAMCIAALKGNFQTAGELNTLLMPLHKLMCIEANPIPIKWTLNAMGWIENTLRLPLTPLSEKHHTSLKEAMQLAGII